MLTDDLPYVLKQGDCVTLMKKLPDGSVDLVVTSPPYDGLKEYKKRMTWEYFRKVASELHRVVKEGGIVVWIVSDIAEDKGGSFRQALSFVEDGFTIHDIMIHKKAFPLLSKVRYRQAFEYMIILTKGEPRAINLLHDQPAKKSKKDKDKIASVRDNIWTYTTGNEIMLSHLAAFPLALAVDHVSSWSKEGDIILDPFLRSGTTGVASMLLDRRFIGFEKEKKYLTIADKRLANWESESIAVDEPCFSDDLYEAWEA